MARPLKILVVTQYFWPENFQINHLTRSLCERGHEVTVLTGKPNYPKGEFFDGYSAFGRSIETLEGAHVIRVPLIPRGSSSAFRLAVNYLSFALSGMLLGPLRVKGRFDCIFVYSPSPITVGLPGLAMGWKTGAPILFWVQDIWPESVYAGGGWNSRVLRAILESMVRFIYRGCSRILIQSQAFRASVTAAGARADRIVYWPQSVDELFRPATPAAEAPVPLIAPGFKIVFAGNVAQAQDFETTLAAAELLRGEPDIRWIVIGDGRRHGWVADEVQRRGLADRFHLVGRHPEAAMPGLLAHADALLVTLRKEPIFALTVPTKVQAYLASGKPIVAGLDGEGARIVEEAGAGATAPASDPARLAEAVMTIYRSTPEQRAAMGQRGLDYSRRNFDRDVLLDQLVTIMRDTVVEAGGAT